MTFPVTEHTVKTARHTTGYLACGAEDAPLLIFVHGWPELSRSWRHQLPVFAELGFRCVAPDMRGYGRSSTYTRHEDFTQEQIVQDMVALLASLGDALKFVLITSAARVQPAATLRAEVTPSTAPKCERCWHYRDDVGADPEHPTICGRCVSNLFGSGEVRTIA